MKKRVKIPMQNAKALLDLAKKVREKHLADGEASPLKVLNWAEINPLIEEAVEADEKALRLKREKLSTYQQRGRRLESMLSLVRSSRDILTGVYSNEMKVLGNWGFDVLDNRAVVPKEDSGETTKTQP
jgi:hypothetical protein